MRESIMDWMIWYNSLAKPEWTPSPATIGLIWSVLYPVILVSVGFVFIKVYRQQWPRKTAVPFGLNLIANLLFMPIFSGLRNLPLALADILIVWSTILWMMISVRRRSGWLLVAQIPYFVWVSIATVLQIAITGMNWGVKP